MIKLSKWNTVMRKISYEIHSWHEKGVKSAEKASPNNSNQKCFDKYQFLRATVVIKRVKTHCIARL